MCKAQCCCKQRDRQTLMTCMNVHHCYRKCVAPKSTVNDTQEDTGSVASVSPYKRKNLSYDDDKDEASENDSDEQHTMVKYEMFIKTLEDCGAEDEPYKRARLEGDSSENSSDESARSEGKLTIFLLLRLMICVQILTSRKCMRLICCWRHSTKVQQ